MKLVHLIGTAIALLFLQCTAAHSLPREADRAPRRTGSFSECRIRTKHTPWKEAVLRTSPCNTEDSLRTMKDGKVVYDLGLDHQRGCGYDYVRVRVGADEDAGRLQFGWVASAFLECESGDAPPAIDFTTDAEKP